MSELSEQRIDYLFMIEQAIKAPSGHNTQPWLFKIGDSEIAIYPDTTKALPVVDPDNRELFVSLGCAAENLCIAATHKGYATAMTVTADGIVKIKLLKQENITPEDLFPQIELRQTNRSVFNGRIIPAETITILNNISSQPGIGVHFFKNGTREFKTIAENVYQGNSRQMNNPDFKQELRLWMRYNKKHQDQMYDGLSYAVFGAPNVPMFIAKAVISGSINEYSQNKADRKKIVSSSHLVLLTSSENTVKQWINLGRILERILLVSTQMGIANAYLNQPNEEREISFEMAKSLGIVNEYPTVLLRMGYGKRVPYSLRRKLESFIPIDK